VIDIAGRVGRKVAFVGRSMVDNVEIAHNWNVQHSGRHGCSSAGHSRLRTTQNRHSRLRFASRADVFLSRIAVDNHRFVSVDENDTVILSSRIIPGNEKAIFRMLDHMFRRRALVYYDNSAGVIHVSGHASQEEQKLLFSS